jgi:hypothetical protein
MFHDMFHDMLCITKLRSPELDGNVGFTAHLVAFHDTLFIHDMFTICSFNSPDLDGYQGTRENKNVPRFFHDMFHDMFMVIFGLAQIVSVSRIKNSSKMEAAGISDFLCVSNHGRSDDGRLPMGARASLHAGQTDVSIRRAYVQLERWIEERWREQVLGLCWSRA